MSSQPAWAVVTTVPVKPGHIDEVATLFRERNPGLVADQPDWKSARLLADRESDTITVIAVWSDPDSYRRYADGPLREAMQEFLPYFTGPPSVVIHEILVDM
jgi:heme-degrading monooxygenase HmoA